MTWTKLSVAVATMALAMNSAWAQDISGDADASTRYSAADMRQGWAPAVNLGVGTLEQNGEADSDGGSVEAQIVGSFYIPRSFWLADVGVGLHQQYFTADEDTSRDPLMGIISTSARYQLPYRWSVGPALQAYIGNGDPFGTTNDFLGMGGILGYKEVVFRDNNVMRLGLKYMTDIAESGQTINYLGLVGEWALGRLNTRAENNSVTSEPTPTIR